MIVLYSTNCPRCNVIRSKLDQKHIHYSICTDMKEITNKGFQQAPVLYTGTSFLDFKQAIEWINNN